MIDFRSSLPNFARIEGNLAEAVRQLGRMVEHPNQNQHHPRPRADGTPCIQNGFPTCMAWCSSSSSSSSSCLCPALPLRSRMLPPLTLAAAEAAAALLRVMRPSELRLCRVISAPLGISIYEDAEPVRFAWKIHHFLLFGQIF